MIKSFFLSFIFCLVCFLSLTSENALAIENPLSVPNNKIGVHILFPSEIKQAADFVNSNGGDWGYVTIAIQAGDKDIEKWQSFMDSAKKYHVIPLIRLATEGDYFNTKVWRKPTDADIVDFANFLDSLNWPTKNRYIIVFNEVNRGDEWGGSTNPSEYASLLSFAVSVFKSKNQDYFIIPAGLDNAAPDQQNLFMNEYNYMRQINYAVPGIYSQVDGLASHSYPNPGFAQPPNLDSSMSIDSFIYEEALAKSLSGKDLPTFITETGWSTDTVSDKNAADYYKTALSTVWSNQNIVAITPFLLEGQGSPFQKFSFLGKDGTFTDQYQAVKNFPKLKGLPIQLSSVLAAETISITQPTEDRLPVKDFTKVNVEDKNEIFSNHLESIYKWMLKIQ